MLQISDRNLKIILNEIDATVATIDSKEDIRIMVARLKEARSKFRSVAAVEDNAFFHYLSFNFFNIALACASNYSRKSEEWYKLNKANIDAGVPKLRKFLESIRGALERKSFEESNEVMANYFTECLRDSAILTEDRE